MIHNLIKLIDNLSKRVPKKYSEIELRNEFAYQHGDISVYHSLTRYHEDFDIWLSCARFLGVLDETPKGGLDA